MEERQEGREEAHFVRLFPFYDEKDSYYRNSFFVKDSEGTEWKGNLGLHLEEELERSEAVHDVALAGDGTWCVISMIQHLLSAPGSMRLLMTNFQASLKDKSIEERFAVKTLGNIMSYEFVRVEQAGISDEAEAATATEERQTELEAAGNQLETEKLERRSKTSAPDFRLGKEYAMHIIWYMGERSTKKIPEIENNVKWYSTDSLVKKWEAKLGTLPKDQSWKCNMCKTWWLSSWKSKPSLGGDK
jgi:hypothetical protein